MPQVSNSSPYSICLLRTSALGDVTHVVPLLRTLQDAWPNTHITWIIGKLEQRLLGDIPDVEFILFDKSQGLEAYRHVRRTLAGRRFDALLHLQVALRANLLSTLVRAPLRIGYDPARAKDLHGLFVNRRIPARTGEHVLDAIGSFAEPLGLRQTRVRWNLPIPDAAHEFAETHLPGSAPTLLLSPCSSHPRRNWQPQRYAAVMAHAARAHGLRIALCGSPSAYERQFGDAILQHTAGIEVVDLIGKDTLKQLLALLQKANIVLTPDSGPMHLANAVGTPVLGLHVASNPQRSGPYSDRRWCVDRYDDAARRYRGRAAVELPWGSKIEHDHVMDLIDVSDVTEKLDAFIHAQAAA